MDIYNKDEIKYYEDNTHIPNSYLLRTRKAISKEVDWIIFKRDALKYQVTRTNSSYTNEWIAHNRLYRLGLFKKHTKDTDLEEPQSLFWKMVWFILGGI